MSSSFDKLATVTADIERVAPPNLVTGAESPPYLVVSGIKCLPLDPVDAQVKINIGIEVGTEILQTTIRGSPDITERDFLIVGSGRFAVRSLAEWTWPPSAQNFTVTYLTEVKK